MLWRYPKIPLPSSSRVSSVLAALRCFVTSFLKAPLICLLTSPYSCSLSYMRLLLSLAFITRSPVDRSHSMLPHASHERISGGQWTKQFAVSFPEGERSHSLNTSLLRCDLETTELACLKPAVPFPLGHRAVPLWPCLTFDASFTLKRNLHSFLVTPYSCALAQPCAPF